MNTEEQDPLWKLLGKAKAPRISPFFARNVLRKMRASKERKAGVLLWLRHSWRLAFLGSIALVLTALNVTKLIQVSDSKLVTMTQQNSNNIDYEVIVNLDELLAYEENTLWLDLPVY